MALPVLVVPDSLSNCFKNLRGNRVKGIARINVLVRVVLRVCCMLVRFLFSRHFKDPS